MRLVEIHKPNIVMTQETMGDEIKISRELSKKIKDWDFYP
jgi:hypothetical protein